MGPSLIETDGGWKLKKIFHFVSLKSQPQMYILRTQAKVKVHIALAFSFPETSTLALFQLIEDLSCTMYTSGMKASTLDLLLYLSEG